MDISCQFQKVWVILANNRLIPILEKMPISLISAIEVHHIAGQKLSHTLRDGLLTRADKQVEVLCEALDYVKLSPPPL